MSVLRVFSLAVVAVAFCLPTLRAEEDERPSREADPFSRPIGALKGRDDDDSGAKIRPGGPGERAPFIPVRFTFFPPGPPTLGSPVPNQKGTSRHQGKALDAPEDLASEVGENFYPALGTRLWEDKLPSTLAQRLQKHRATRAALVHELLDELTTADLAEPAVREKHLREFAARQTPRIAAWEEEAEELRADLVGGKGLGASFNWNLDRIWRLRQTAFQSPQQEAFAERLVLRAAAYYQNGLGTEQRWLLREIELELEQRTLAMFFSPGTARLELPASLPAAIRAKIAGYNGEREALKGELREAVVASDVLSERARTAALRKLTERQWPRLVALEATAEEIRRALAGLPPPPPPKLPPPLPQELVARIDAYKRDRVALNAELYGQLSGLFRSRSSRGGGLPDPAAFRAERSRLIEEFRALHAERYADLERRAAALRNELDTLARVLVDPETGKPTDAAALMRDYNAAMLEFEALGRREVIYSDYETAMLQPGLSVEQRRLLFSAALVRLSQPLPSGRRMPNGEALPHRML